MADAPDLSPEALEAPLTREEWVQITAASDNSYRLWRKRATQDARDEDNLEWHREQAIARAYGARLRRLADALRALAGEKQAQAAEIARLRALLVSSMGRARALAAEIEAELGGKDPSPLGEAVAALRKLPLQLAPEGEDAP